MQQKLVNVLVLLVAAAVVRAEVKVSLTTNIEHNKLEVNKDFTLGCKVEGYTLATDLVKAHYLVTIERHDSNVATFEYKSPDGKLAAQLFPIPVATQTDIKVENPLAPTPAPAQATPTVPTFPTEFSVKVTPSQIHAQEYWCKFSSVEPKVDEIKSTPVKLSNSSFAALPSLLVLALASLVSLKFGIFA